MHRQTTACRTHCSSSNSEQPAHAARGFSHSKCISTPRSNNNPHSQQFQLLLRSQTSGVEEIALCTCLLTRQSYGWEYLETSWDNASISIPGIANHQACQLRKQYRCCQPQQHMGQCHRWQEQNHQASLASACITAVNPQHWRRSPVRKGTEIQSGDEGGSP